ncbi:efflux RND transporter periplasmic adaptor subunit [Neiella marina]|uniref:Efflux RND transporter periplasmic adaptor subunit n=1 Tax=Neiella holothuriorum TaxID=2870530 RepID=A0ABS7EIM5_9GAMM|nr:efflux RND transporter periplasmic adaptor subunit [Neiella holothuriorum]MBW8191738.1 efflux RND transporter periplasmic adaptor subunit [Neiella holothuriorum]
MTQFRKICTGLVTGAAVVLSAHLPLAYANTDETAVTDNIIRPVKMKRLGAPGERSIRTFQGQAEASMRTTLAFRVPGQLVEMPAIAGQHVKQGDLLARLDPIEYELTRDKAKAHFELAEVQFKRTERLVKDQLVSQRMHDENRATLSRAQALLEQTEANVGYTYLKAPFDGVVSRTAVENFDYVQAKAQIISVQADGMTDVNIQIPQHIVTQFTREFFLNLQAEVRFVAQPSYRFMATVREVETEADPQTLSFKVTLTLPTPTEFNVTTGMTAQVDVDLAPLDPLQVEYYVVPKTAVFESESGATQVWRVAPDTMQAHAVPVKVLGNAQRGIRISGELSAGDQIATTGVDEISENMVVREWIRERGI